jgi:hypothetical protein
LTTAFVLVVVTSVELTAQTSTTTTSTAPGLTDFQKETIGSIREITLQLILLSLGVVALMGGFAADKDKTFAYRWLGWFAFFGFGLSVVAGLFAYGNLIHMLGSSMFTSSGTIANLALIQWVAFGIAGATFMLFVLVNMKGR